MGKVGIVTDSTAYLPLEFKEKYQIEVVSLVVNYDDKSIPEEGIFYKGLDDFYNWLRQLDSSHYITAGNRRFF